jgi:hypothetical protein
VNVVDTLGTWLLALIVLLVWPTAAWSDQGVAVDVGRIDVADVLHPGRSYVLPSIGVRNPGTRTSGYTLRTRQIHSELLSVPEDWVAFVPASLHLRPGEQERIEPTLDVPIDAEPGDYEVLVTARLDGGEGAGASVGAAAATRLTFSVGGDPESVSDTGEIRNSSWLVAVGLAVVLVSVASRFRGVRIRIERTS